MQTVSIIIPIYKETLTISENISLNRCFEILKAHSICFVAPKHMEKSDFYSKWNIIADFIFFDNSYFNSIHTYNKLLLSNSFYNSFLNYDYLLIYQLDAFVFQDELFSWIKHKYSYIGAPWFIPNTKEFLGVGNGGFSLRNVKDCLRVVNSNRKVFNYKDCINSIDSKYLIKKWFLGIKKYFYQDTFKNVKFNKLVNEDKIFWQASNRFDFFKVPNALEATNFAFEKEPEYCFKINKFKLPFGWHAFEKYDYSFFKRLCSENQIDIK